mgnify:CR=1 FL=1
MFQFLIGTLKTYGTYEVGAMKVKFQFLIGTLKTAGASSGYNGKTMFQFLIGTLKTGHAPGEGRKKIIVSIPDRYSKN